MNFRLFAGEPEHLTSDPGRALDHTAFLQDILMQTHSSMATPEEIFSDEELAK